MADSFMRSGLGWLAEQTEDVGGELVTYVRGSKSIEILASFGRNAPSRSAVADGRVQFEVEPMDFLIRPSRIDFGDGATEPARGDRITIAGGNVFEVGPRDGEPEFRKSDPFGNLYRIRTTRVI